MKYVLDGSNLCCQIYLSQYVFCANHTRMVSVKNGIFCRNALYIGIAWLRLRLFENEKIRMVFTGVSLLASPCKQIFCTGDQNKNVFEGETTFYGFVMDIITNPYLPVCICVRLLLTLHIWQRFPLRTGWGHILILSGSY